MSQAFFLMTEYGHRDVTVKCVDSIMNTFTGKKTIIVGNDGNWDYIKMGMVDAEVINFEKNVGYVKNCNRIVNAIKDRVQPEDVFFIINNDIEFLDNAIEVLLCAASFNNGIFGPAVKVPSHYIKDPDHTPRQFLPTKELDWIPMTVLSGCCFVMRAEIWFDLGGLDEDYSCWYSDDQFCIDTKKKGYSVFFIPEAKIIHKVRATLGTDKKSRLSTRRDAIVFRQKNPGLKWSATGIFEVDVDGT